MYRNPFNICFFGKDEFDSILNQKKYGILKRKVRKKYNIAPLTQIDPTKIPPDVPNTVIFASSHDLSAGDEVTYTTNGPAIGGLTDGANYYVIAVDAERVQLASTVGGAPITLDPSTTTPSHSIGGQGFDPVADVNYTTDTLTVTAHGWASGSPTMMVCHGCTRLIQIDSARLKPTAYRSYISALANFSA